MKNRQINRNFFDQNKQGNNTLIQSNSSNVLMKKLEQCKKTGILNMSSLSPPLHEIPKELFDLYFNFNENDKFWEIETLKSLDFSFNQLADLPKELLLFNDIQTLKLKNNILTSFFPLLEDHEENFQNFFQNLRILDLSFNQIREINNERLFHSLINLKELNLSNNQLERIPSGVFYLNQIRIFECQNNHLRTLFHPPTMNRFDVPLLITLNLSKNHLTEFSQEFLNHCKLLENLDLSQNSLTSFPSIQVNKSLKYLNLSQNKLKQFPIFEIVLPALNQLILSFNQISSLEPLQALLHLKDSLSELLISNNAIPCLPLEIEYLQKLKVLDVSNNNLNDLPHTIGYINSLQIIKLEGNCIRAIRQTILVKPSEEIKKYLRTRGDSILTGMDIREGIPVDQSFGKMSASEMMTAGPGTGSSSSRKAVGGFQNPSSAVANNASPLLTSRIYDITSKNNLLNFSACSLTSIALSRYPFLEAFQASQPLIATITKIDLSRNELTEFPIVFLYELIYDFHVTTINSINLAKNKFYLGKLSSLSSNDVKALERIQPVYSQLSLDFSENSFSLPLFENLFYQYFSTSFLSLSSLILHHNPLVQFPATIINQCIHLQHIELAYCQLINIQSFQIENLKNLKYLDLSNNKIQLIPNNFSMAWQLEFFSIENNEISSIPTYLGILPNLKTLLIQGNSQKLIRPMIIQQGSAKVIEYLKCRHDPSSLPHPPAAVPSTAMAAMSLHGESSLPVKNSSVPSRRGEASDGFRGQDRYDGNPDDFGSFERNRPTSGSSSSRVTGTNTTNRGAIERRSQHSDYQEESDYYKTPSNPSSMSGRSRPLADYASPTQPRSISPEDSSYPPQNTELSSSSSSTNVSRAQRVGALQKLNSRKLLSYSNSNK